jgi:hypothetical protein
MMTFMWLPPKKKHLLANALYPIWIDVSYFRTESEIIRRIIPDNCNHQ